METKYQLKYLEYEESHWWFKARRNMILKLLRSTDRNAKILDIGCSGGALIRHLRKHGFVNLFGIDLNQEAVDHFKKQGLKNVFVMDGQKLEFPDEKFDVIIASDVLEHIKNDDSSLKEWKRVLKQNGKLILFVPAFNFLWSEHDEANRHFRRYTKKDINEKIRAAGFEIERISYWNIILFFPKIVVNIIQGEKGDQLRMLHPLLNYFLTHLLKVENLILERFDSPVGVSVFSVARK